MPLPGGVRLGGNRWPLAVPEPSPSGMDGRPSGGARRTTIEDGGGGGGGGGGDVWMQTRSEAVTAGSARAREATTVLGNRVFPWAARGDGEMLSRCCRWWKRLGPGGRVGAWREAGDDEVKKEAEAEWGSNRRRGRRKGGGEEREVRRETE
ncbi:hypothetical protein CDD83_2768 [Cordyceps sp. RAO-2017]|nr:hypothetical protein CDD83_2768 [Cordyceps sp. RAO-2017]